MTEPHDLSTAGSSRSDVDRLYASAMAETESLKGRNLCLSMLSDPRATIRYLIDTETSPHVLLLTVLWGATSGLVLCTSLGSSHHPTRHDLLLAAVLGAAWGVAYLLLMGWMYGVAGRMLGGVGRAADCRMAIAWSSVPTLLWLPACVTLIVAPHWLGAVLGIVAVAAVWQMWLLWQTIGEAHRFSSLRGCATTLLAGYLALGAWLAGVVCMSLVTGG